MGVHAYGTSPIQDAGCGPTALAIVISALTGEDVTPQMNQFIELMQKHIGQA